MAAYYNEFDPNAAQWLRNLIKAGLIADGEVDDRSIVHVHPDDLKGFTQCHFFAGIGAWSYALRRANWPDDKPVWTGSCPCQPFSAAGQKLGYDDERHLAPVWLGLIRECRPAALFGEQVEKAISKHWLDDLFHELEGTGYACGSSVLPACSVGSPHIRQRLWFGGSRLAESDMYGDRRAESRSDGQAGSPAIGHGADVFVARESGGASLFVPGRLAYRDSERREGERLQHLARESDPEAGGSGEADLIGLADADGSGREWRQGTAGGSVTNGSSAGWTESLDGLLGGGEIDLIGLADSGDAGLQGRVSGRQDEGRETEHGYAGRDCTDFSADQDNGFWGAVDWLGCRDGKWRPVEPGTFPLANGATSRMVKLRAYGNAIVPEVAEAFIIAFDKAAGDVVRRFDLDPLI